MQVVIRPGEVRLEDRENFREFKILAYTAPDMSLLASALRAASAGEGDGAHGWIAEAWLRGQEADPAWQAGLSKMLQFAKSKGWVNDAGAVRAHVEWA